MVLANPLCINRLVFCINLSLIFEVRVIHTMYVKIFKKSIDVLMLKAENIIQLKLALSDNIIYDVHLMKLCCFCSDLKYNILVLIHKNVDGWSMLLGQPILYYLGYFSTMFLS